MLSTGRVPGVLHVTLINSARAVFGCSGKTERKRPKVDYELLQIGIVRISIDEAISSRSRGVTRDR